ncbi:MAG: hydrogenase 2 operon protein HybA [Anaeromyxobacter sp.]
MSRRDLLKGAAVAGAATAVAGTAEARSPRVSDPESVGMLYDSTLCIGCRACVTKCKKENNKANGGTLAPTTAYDQGDLQAYQQPEDLNAGTKNIIKALRKDDRTTFVKQQCMHCIDPSCVSVCMMGALHKEGAGKRHMDGEIKGTGIVLYDKLTCVGCRYCQIGCAFNVPKFEWTDAFPLIQKCELCSHRRDKSKPAGDIYAVANPGCCEICPRAAVIYGKRVDLMAEAKRRLAAEPEKYNGEIYGEKEGGGTQVLYLAPKGVSFAELGMPTLPEEAAAEFSEEASHAPYLYGITPVALYAAMAFVIHRNHKKEAEAGGHEEGK